MPFLWGLVSPLPHPRGIPTCARYGTYVYMYILFHSNKSQFLFRYPTPSFIKPCITTPPPPKIQNTPLDGTYGMEPTEIPIELPNNFNYPELRETAEAACRNMSLMEKHDVEVNLTPFTPEPAEDKPEEGKGARRASSTTVSLLEAYNILEEYGGSLNATPEDIKNTVVNKLLLETENPDARIRLQALQFLGKINEIGLFAEKKEVTITHQNAADIKNKLKERLLELKQNAEGVYEAKSS